jgi:hypothetical protein
VAASDFPTRMLQKAVRPIWSCFAEGCRPDCETPSAITAAGFGEVQFESFHVAVPVIHPHISGTSRLLRSFRNCESLRPIDDLQTMSVEWDQMICAYDCVS